VSFGIENTKEEVDTLIRVLADIANQTQSLKNKRSESGANGESMLKKADIKRHMDDFVGTISDRVYR
jgi:hypothetical protein